MVALPLLAPLRGAPGGARRVLVVRARTDLGDGWGECAALERPTYTAEYVDGARRVVADHLAPRLFAALDLAADLVGPGPLDDVAGHPMAKAACEMALLDAELRAAGRSLAAHLGGTEERPERVAAGAVVGERATLAQTVAEATALAERGYRRVKLKVGPGWDVEPLRAVRAALGGGVALAADANGAYVPADAEYLRALDDLALSFLEQPLAADRLLDSAGLARSLATPVCLDEAVPSAAVAADAVALGACSVLNVKPGRLGGLAEAVWVHDLCRGAGVAAWVGGMVETGLAKAAGVALATLPGFTLPGDLPASDRWFAEDLTEPFVLDADGHLGVPTGPGLGVEPRPDALSRFTEWSEERRP